MMTMTMTTAMMKTMMINGGDDDDDEDGDDGNDNGTCLREFVKTSGALPETGGRGGPNATEAVAPVVGITERIELDPKLPWVRDTK